LRRLDPPPAACCGIVGPPTYGRVSRAGVMPLSWSLDHVGPMARTVRDAALLLGVIAGPDPHDATSSRRAVPDYAGALDGPIGGLRVAVPENYYWDGVDSQVDAAVRAAIATLGELGARVAELHLPDPRLLVDVANIVARCESAASTGGSSASSPTPSSPPCARGSRSASTSPPTTTCRRRGSGRG
jgi:aspartyl-tRNA(Asn)/glutamyl-tRNA(Gln) amidotransferase subunit A